MKIIAITGGIATGKTSVANILMDKGYVVINADKISNKILYKNLEKVYQIFGDSVKNDDNTLNKVELRKVVFNNKEKRKELEKLIHPKVYAEIIFRLLYYAFMGKSIIFMEIPLFFECKLNKYFDSIVVYCDYETQRNRLIERDGNLLIDQKIKSQMDIKYKICNATYTIDNSNLIESTKIQLDKINFKGVNIYFYIIYILVLLMVYSDLK
ncbi:dephospho-CoA kinase [Hamiltosporidium tvaerminnensis]|uniref:Dephospho-CoA kinase n=1 Tax=Hamiltosporidium tvaerminnensis TaxID=1176355 RepID=A0A4Q9LTH9_9MICR|nr:dephospho-CoA kinase [Hamiltosporidium tvaerminnensis]